MPVKITVRPAATATSTVDIKESTKKEVEDIWAQMKAHPNHEAHLAFTDEAERLEWTREARAYCQTRKAGALRFRALPSKNLPDNEGRYLIADDLEKNGERNGKRKQA